MSLSVLESSYYDVRFKLLSSSSIYRHEEKEEDEVLFPHFNAIQSIKECVVIEMKELLNKSPLSPRFLKDS